MNRIEKRQVDHVRQIGVAAQDGFVMDFQGNFLIEIRDQAQANTPDGWIVGLVGVWGVGDWVVSDIAWQRWWSVVKDGRPCLFERLLHGNF